MVVGEVVITCQTTIAETARVTAKSVVSALTRSAHLVGMPAFSTSKDPLHAIADDTRQICGFDHVPRSPKACAQSQE